MEPGFKFYFFPTVCNFNRASCSLVFKDGGYTLSVMVSVVAPSSSTVVLGLFVQLVMKSRKCFNTSGYHIEPCTELARVGGEEVSLKSFI